MKTFTLTQAEAVLPILRREMATLQPVYRNLRKRYAELARSRGISLEDPKLRDVCLEDAGIRALFLQVEESLCLFQALGVECKGIEQGIFDFPCLLEDRMVFLCWQADEDAIAHWHELDTDYDARKPLFEACRLGSPLESRLPN
ncbi:MAG: DUF2203 domain-containing protein [Bdellovibrionales bacterium]|nr:DUF2203 domain-containing protein [Bdellovibrionales bacterium]